MPRYTFVVLTNHVIGREDEFNQWYDERHLPDVLAIDGFVAAQRFRLADTDPPQQYGHRYLALYEVETDDLNKAHRALIEVAGTADMTLSDAFDSSSAAAAYFTPMTDRVTAADVS
jgi:hypothetical protein